MDLSTVGAIKRLKNINIEVDSVIDVGASNGMWTKNLLPIFPEAKYLLIEANPYHQKALDNFVSDKQNVQYELCAAGNLNEEIFFDATDPFGGLAYNNKPSLEGVIKVNSKKVDTLVHEANLSPKHLLKLDTHGFEVPIFEGAQETLKNTNVIVVETYAFRIGKNTLKFYEMCKYLENLGFSCVDISEPLWREKDGLFWQIDLVFIPSSHPNLAYEGYN